MFSFSAFPLMIFHVIGFAAGAVFLGLGGFAIFCKLFTEQAIPGWTSHMLTGSFFGSLNALGISILGEYVIRIYDQVRGRPQYVVDRTVNLNPSRTADEDEAADLLDEVRQLLREGSLPTLPTAYDTLLPDEMPELLPSGY